MTKRIIALAFVFSVAVPQAFAATNSIYSPWSKSSGTQLRVVGKGRGTVTSGKANALMFGIATNGQISLGANNYGAWEATNPGDGLHTTTGSCTLSGGVYTCPDSVTDATGNNIAIVGESCTWTNMGMGMCKLEYKFHMDTEDKDMPLGGSYNTDYIWCTNSTGSCTPSTMTNKSDETTITLTIPTASCASTASISVYGLARYMMTTPVGQTATYTCDKNSTF